MTPYLTEDEKLALAALLKRTIEDAPTPSKLEPSRPVAEPYPAPKHNISRRKLSARLTA
jgi:hypothetical protein